MTRFAEQMSTTYFGTPDRSPNSIVDDLSGQFPKMATTLGFLKAANHIDGDADEAHRVLFENSSLKSGNVEYSLNKIAKVAKDLGEQFVETPLDDDLREHFQQSGQLGPQYSLDGFIYDNLDEDAHEEAFAFEYMWDHLKDDQSKPYLADNEWSNLDPSSLIDKIGDQGFSLLIEFSNRCHETRNIYDEFLVSREFVNDSDSSSNNSPYYSYLPDGGDPIDSRTTPPSPTTQFGCVCAGLAGLTMMILGSVHGNLAAVSGGITLICTALIQWPDDHR